MRWFSHRARTWKNTVLKIKIKKKTKGFTLVATALAVLCWIFIAQAFFMMSSGTLSTVKAERTAYQAEQNTALDVSRLKALDYDDLDSKGAHARKVIEGVGDGNWESEVTIDPEQPLNGGDDDAKLRIAHVKVYRTGDTTSRYSLDVPLTSQSADTGKLAQLYWIDHTENYYRTLQLATKYDGKEHVLHKFSQWTIPVFSFEEDFPAQPSYAGYRTYWIQFPNGSGEAIDLGWMYESDIISYIKNSIMPKYNLTVIRYQGSIGGKKSEGFITR